MQNIRNDAVAPLLAFGDEYRLAASRITDRLHLMDGETGRALAGLSVVYACRSFETRIGVRGCEARLGLEPRPAHVGPHARASEELENGD